jgi:hypothetical protein
VGACVLAFGAAVGAAEETRTRSAVFDVTLTGTQKLQWTRNYEDDFGEEDEQGNPIVYRCKGSGSEVIKFATTSPRKVRVELSGSGRNRHPRFKFSGGSFHDPSFAVKANVHRIANFSAVKDCGKLVPHPQGKEGAENWHSCDATADRKWWLQIRTYHADLYWFQRLPANGKRNKGVTAPCKNNGLVRFPFLFYNGVPTYGIPGKNPDKLFDTGKATTKAHGNIPWRDRGDEPGQWRETIDMRWTMKFTKHQN